MADDFAELTFGHEQPGTDPALDMILRSMFAIKLVSQLPEVRARFRRNQF
jgi:hypothetical protein